MLDLITRVTPGSRKIGMASELLRLPKEHYEEILGQILGRDDVKLILVLKCQKHRSVAE